MVPVGEVTGKIIEDLASRMDAGDTIIDGGNSYYRDDIRRAAGALSVLRAPLAPGWRRT